MSHQVGFVGLGKMGKLMAGHVRSAGIDVISYNRTATPEATVKSLDELVASLNKPRIIFLMVSAGAVDEVIGQLNLEAGDMLVDGGNTFYKDTVRRHEELKTRGIQYIDCGTSGGLEGAQHGACLMLGGDESVISGLSWLWDALATKDGWAYIGPSGAGHFAKMVHNGIEYGEVEALGEGIEIITKSPYHIDIAKLTAVWKNGSIIRGYLVELLARSLANDPEFSKFTGKIGGGETGGWALAAAREFGVEATVLEAALAARHASQTNPSTKTKVVSALRQEYGGHEEAS